MWSKESRQSRGYGKEWDKLRKIVMRRDSFLCCCDECIRLGRIRPAQAVDHRIPKAQGGTDDLSNLCAINTACHQAKTDRENGRSPRKKRYGGDGWPGG